MLDEAAQRAAFQRVADAALRRGLLVAPVGSIYFLFQGEPKLMTKDVDAVVHDEDLQPVSVDVLRALGEELGEVQVSADKALVVVVIREEGEEPIQVDLLRGRAGAKGGFLNRGLLASGAARGTRTGNVILYPPEYVVVLKADAAVDRAKRAEKMDRHAAENARRAEAFRTDVITQVRALERHKPLDVATFRAALDLVKERRRAAVAELIEVATAGRIRLSS